MQDARHAFRILALDGGGIMGAFTASVLSELARNTGQPIAEHFDLITGTSTGGILAIGLGLGFSPDELLDFYQTDGPRIFPSTGFAVRSKGLVRHLLRPKHSQDVLRSALHARLGDRKLGDSKSRLAIPTYDAVSGRIYIMKTAHHSRFIHDANAAAVDVALATSAAPTFFSAAPFSHHRGTTYIDGGVWANNPTMVGLTEAVAFLDVQPRDVHILSIGTTDTARSFARLRSAGVLGWNKRLLDILMAGQMEGALAQANLLTGNQAHRIDAITPPGSFSLDNARPDAIRDLASLGRSAAAKRQHLSVVEARFLTGVKAAPFAPFVRNTQP